MDKVLEKEIKRVSNLKQNKGKSEEELKRQAVLNLRVKDFEEKHVFASKEDKKIAKERYLKYLEQYELDDMSELDNLGDLVYNEVQLRKIEQSIKDFYDKHSDNPHFAPDKLLDSKKEIGKEILNLKKHLKIDSDKEEDELNALQLTKKRFYSHILQNRNEYTWWIPYKCHDCGYEGTESYLMTQRVKDFKALKHPWYVGRFLFNYEIVKDVRDGKLNKQDATRYLLGSGKGGHHKARPNDRDRKYCEDLIDFCLENFNEITKLLAK